MQWNRRTLWVRLKVVLRLIILFFVILYISRYATSTPDSLPTPLSQKSYGYFAFLCDDLMLDAASVLAYSLKKTTTYDYVFLVLDNVSQKSRDQLERLGAKVRVVDPLPYPSRFILGRSDRAVNRGCRYSKLHIWNQIDYEKIVYLDIDTLVVENVDELFSYPELSAVFDLGGYFNTGVMVLKPSSERFLDLTSNYFNAPSYNRGDQGYLNWYFVEYRNLSVTYLPQKYNVIPKLQSYEAWKPLLEKGSIYHYTSQTKPWNFYNIGPHKLHKVNFNSYLFSKWTQTYEQFNRFLDESFPLRDPICETFSKHLKVPQILDDTQFSILVGTWNREEALLGIIKHYLKNPQVNHVYVTWHNPATNISLAFAELIQREPNITILYQKRNSLNNRFLPIQELTTSSVFVTDDDVLIEESDLALAHSVWLNNRLRLVGYFIRSHIDSKNISEVRYLLKENQGGGYSIALTKGIFLSTDYLFIYSCLIPLKLTAYVDKVSNCEDILLNFIVSGFTGLGPVGIKGTVFDFGVGSGISSDITHLNNRDICLRTFIELIGSNTLVHSRGFVGFSSTSVVKKNISLLIELGKS